MLDPGINGPPQVSKEQRLKRQPKVVCRVPDDVDWRHVERMLSADNCIGINNPQLLADIRGLVAWRLEQEADN